MIILHFDLQPQFKYMNCFIYTSHLFTSLHPWTNKYGTYPISHPEILTTEALIDRSPCDFYGLIKCDVLPPSFLFHPGLPYRAQGKLMFPLCRTCAENFQGTPCEHSEEERMLSGTWCSIEIQKALDIGYRVIRMVEVWHFPSNSSDLFTGYQTGPCEDQEEP